MVKRAGVLRDSECRALVQAAVDRFGRIDILVNNAGVTSTGSSIAYAASKAALNSMTQALARTLGPEIRVNAVAPGPIDTRWIRNGIGEEGYQAIREKQRRTTPLQEIIPAEVVAEAIVWLAEGASFTTGEVLLVDSGAHLGPTAGASGIAAPS